MEKESIEQERIKQLGIQLILAPRPGNETATDKTYAPTQKEENPQTNRQDFT